MQDVSGTDLPSRTLEPIYLATKLYENYVRVLMLVRVSARTGRRA